MRNEEILKKAFDKALENGFRTDWYRRRTLTVDEQYGNILSMTGLSDVILSHDFAKAFWGNDIYMKLGSSIKAPIKLNEVKEYVNTIIEMPEWQYHLQQMVLEQNPIKYLERFL